MSNFPMPAMMNEMPIKEKDKNKKYFCEPSGFSGLDLFGTGADETEWDHIKMIQVREDHILVTSRIPSECLSFTRSKAVGDTSAGKSNAVYNKQKNMTYAFFVRNNCPLKTEAGSPEDREYTKVLKIEKDDDGARTYFRDMQTRLSTFARSSIFFGKVEAGSSVHALQIPSIIMEAETETDEYEIAHTSLPGRANVYMIPSFASPLVLFNQFGLDAEFKDD